VRIVVAVVGGIAVMCGCASTALGASVEDDVLAALQKFSTASETSDVDGQVAFYSEGWYRESGMTKADLRAYLQEEIDQDREKGTGFDLDQVEVVVDGDSATIDFALLRSPTGGGSFEFKMIKEPDGVWRCLSLSLSTRTDVSAENARSLRERIASDPGLPPFYGPTGVRGFSVV